MAFFEYKMQTLPPIPSIQKFKIESQIVCLPKSSKIF